MSTSRLAIRERGGQLTQPNVVKGRVLNDLRKLVQDGASRDTLPKCEALMDWVSGKIPAPGIPKPALLDLVLRAVIEQERAGVGEPSYYLRAAAEFIGYPDESKENPPCPDYEEGTDLDIRHLRGGRELKRPVGTARNASTHVNHALDILFRALDDFLSDPATAVSDPQHLVRADMKVEELEESSEQAKAPGPLARSDSPVAKVSLSHHYILAAAVLVVVGVIITSVTLVWVKEGSSSPRTSTINLIYASGDKPEWISGTLNGRAARWRVDVDNDRIRTVFRPVDGTVPLEWLEGSVEFTYDLQDPCSPSTYIEFSVELAGSSVARGKLSADSAGQFIHVNTPGTVDEIVLRAELHSGASCRDVALDWQFPHFVGPGRR